MLTELLLHRKASPSLCYIINLSKKCKLVYVLCTCIDFITKINRIKV